MFIRLLIVVLTMASAPLAGAGGLSPQESLGRFVVAEGLKIELVASEPDVRQPVTMTFDDRGRMWVIQYIQYPTPAGLQPIEVDRYLRTRYDKLPEPPPTGPRGADRITILEDTNGDGRADHFKDFVTGLNLASGMALGHGGVFVLQAPYLLYYPDRDSNDVPDGDPEVLLTGFGMEVDAHAVANSLQWGPDGWLYGAQGSTVTANVRDIEFQQGIWRYHPLTKEFELFAEGGGNTWGLDFDDAGQAIAGTNFGGVASLHQVQGAYYVKNFGKHGALHNPHAYGYFEHLPYDGAENIQNGEHVMCGGVVYQGGALPSYLNGQYITCALLHRAIYWHHLQPHGSSFKNAWGGKLLTTDDIWFRPIDLCVGPDGALYVADWYDERANHVDPADTWDKTNGRIYRISTAAEKEGAKPFDLARLSSEELLNLLRHNNRWFSRQARRLLAERRDPTVIPKLRGIIDATGDQPLAVEALWALYVSGGWNETLARELLDHQHAPVRAWTVRFLGDGATISAFTRDTLTNLASEEHDVTVRNQLACTSKRLSGRHALPIIEQLIARSEDVSDPQLPLLLWWAIEDKAVSDRDALLRLLRDSKRWELPIVRQYVIERLARRYLAEGTDAGLAACAQLLQLAPTPASQRLVIGGLEQELRGRKLNRPAAVLEEPIVNLLAQHPADWPLLRLAIQLGIADARQRGLKLLSDSAVPEADRAALVTVLAQDQDPELLSVLLQVLRQDSAPRVQSAALQSLRQYASDEVSAELLQYYPRAAGKLRSEIIQVLTARHAWSLALVQQVDAGVIPAKAVYLEQVQQMALHVAEEPASPLQGLIEKHWGTIRPVTPGEVQARIGAVANTLGKGQGNLPDGKKLFTQHCATCHALFGEGNKVGPDLTGFDRANRQFLLQNIIDPAGQVRAEFAAYVVQTVDGRVLTGLMADSSDQHVTLLTAKNERIRIERADIEVLKQSETSLMPEKILDPLRPQELRDLFAYLQSGGK